MLDSSNRIEEFNVFAEGGGEAICFVAATTDLVMPRRPFNVKPSMSIEIRHPNPPHLERIASMVKGVGVDRIEFPDPFGLALSKVVLNDLLPVAALRCDLCPDPFKVWERFIEHIHFLTEPHSLAQSPPNERDLRPMFTDEPNDGWICKTSYNIPRQSPPRDCLLSVYVTRVLFECMSLHHFAP